MPEVGQLKSVCAVYQLYHVEHIIALLARLCARSDAILGFIGFIQSAARN